MAGRSQEKRKGGTHINIYERLCGRGKGAARRKGEGVLTLTYKRRGLTAAWAKPQNRRGTTGEGVFKIFYARGIHIKYTGGYLRMEKANTETRKHGI